MERESSAHGDYGGLRVLQHYSKWGELQRRVGVGVDSCVGEVQLEC